jgi:nucleoid-associated protein YgaU
MFLKDSRYAQARDFEPAADGSRFAGVRPRQIGPAAGVVEHVVKSGDRLDLLARHYYNDDRLWWRIAEANPEFAHAEQMLDQPAGGENSRLGQVIIIPRAKEG